MRRSYRDEFFLEDEAVFHLVDVGAVVLQLAVEPDELVLELVAQMQVLLAQSVVGLEVLLGGVHQVGELFLQSIQLDVFLLALQSLEATPCCSPLVCPTSPTMLLYVSSYTCIMSALRYHAAYIMLSTDSISLDAMSIPFILLNSIDIKSIQG